MMFRNTHLGWLERIWIKSFSGDCYSYLEASASFILLHFVNKQSKLKPVTINKEQLVQKNPQNLVDLPV